MPNKESTAELHKVDHREAVEDWLGLGPLIEQKWTCIESGLSASQREFLSGEIDEQTAFSNLWDYGVALAGGCTEGRNILRAIGEVKKTGSDDYASVISAATVTYLVEEGFQRSLVNFRDMHPQGGSDADLREHQKVIYWWHMRNYVREKQPT